MVSARCDVRSQDALFFVRMDSLRELSIYSHVSITQISHKRPQVPPLVKDPQITPTT